MNSPDQPPPPEESSDTLSLGGSGDSVEWRELAREIRDANPELHDEALAVVRRMAESVRRTAPRKVPALKALFSRRVTRGSA
jgi:hypothetical protein